MKPAPKIRTQLLIDPRFQLSFLGFVFSMVFGAMGVLYLGHLYFHAQFKALIEKSDLHPNHPLIQAWQQQQDSANNLFLLTAVFFAILVLSIGLSFSSRAAGPIFRLRQHLADVRHGHVRKHDLHFREEDFFQYIPRELRSSLPQPRKRKKAS